MADIRMAGSSLLTTVTEVANTATSLVTSIGTGAKMLNSFADNAYWQQSKRIAVSKVGFEDNLKVTHALEILKSRSALHEYVSANPSQETELTAIMAELTAALA